MTVDLDEPVALLSVPTEAEALAIINALAEQDIQAIITGDYTTGFKAEAPGYAAVVIKRADLARARAAWEEIQQHGEFDWSEVQVTAEQVDEENMTSVDEAAAESDARRQAIGGVLWIAEVTGIVVCILVWVFTRRVGPLLIYAVPALLIIAMLIVLNRPGRLQNTAAAPMDKDFVDR